MDEQQNTLGTIVVHATCRFCHKESRFYLPRERALRWRNGEFIQWVFPELSATTRETLISGTCSKCQEDIFSEDEEPVSHGT